MLASPVLVPSEVADSAAEDSVEGASEAADYVEGSVVDSAGASQVRLLAGTSLVKISMPIILVLIKVVPESLGSRGVQGRKGQGNMGPFARSTWKLDEILQGIFRPYCPCSQLR